MIIKLETQDVEKILANAIREMMPAMKDNTIKSLGSPYGGWEFEIAGKPSDPEEEAT